MLWRVLRAILFCLDPERAHHLTVCLIKWAHKTLGPRPLLWISGASDYPHKNEEVRVFGLGFSSRVGLAAGFDKDANLLSALPHLGFGFAEVGTVTPLAQPGNPKPRLLRDVQQRALFNCMGFNNEGAQAVAHRVEAARATMPSDFRLGVNVGKNKDTPLEQASRDYALAAQPFLGLVDYVVLNVSSPNTPGLRSLQTSEALKLIVSATRDVLDRHPRPPALLLKLAPELQADALSELIASVEAWKATQGWILTNTLAGSHQSLTGGWSGAVLREAALSALKTAKKASKLPIISVGGIMSAEDAKERLDAGAELIQIYTGWVYGGPSFPRQLETKRP